MSRMRRSAGRKHLLCVVVLLVVVGAVALPAAAISPLPPNDDFANAEDLGTGLSASASGSNLWATAEPREPGGISGRPIASVWYRWTAPQDGAVKVDTCDSDFDTRLVVFRGAALDALGRVAANDDLCGHRSAVRFFAIAGTTYHIAVDGPKGAQGSIELRLSVLHPPSNDDFANALNLGTRSSASVSGTNRDATIEPREPNHVGSGTIASVWYRWTAGASNRFRVDTCGSHLDTVIAVYAGQGLDALREVASNDDSCGTRSRASFRAVAGRTYYIAVAGYRRAEGSFRLNLTQLERHKAR